MPSAPSSPTDVVRQFMKLMEPLDYDAALRLVSDNCEYTNPPPARRDPRPGRHSCGPGAVFLLPETNEFRVLRAAASGPIVFLERLTATSSERNGWSCQ